MTPFLISQILAGITFVIGMTAFQFKDRKHILRGWFLAAIVAAAHFFFLGKVEAGVLVTITGVRFLVSSYTTDQRLMYLFMALSLTGFAFTYEEPVSFLALASVLIGTWGSFRKDETQVRVTMMSTEIIWVIHNIIVWSPVAVAMEVFFFISNLTGLIRHRRATETAL